MKKNILLAFIVLILGVLVVVKTPQKPKEIPTPIPVVVVTPQPTPIELNGDILFAMINEWRREQKLPGFKKNDVACQFAEERLPEVIADFSHDGALKKVKVYYQKYPNLHHIDENLAEDQTTEYSVLYEWEKSPEHLKNLKTSLPFLCVKTSGSTSVAIWMD